MAFIGNSAPIQCLFTISPLPIKLGSNILDSKFNNDILVLVNIHFICHVYRVYDLRETRIYTVNCYGLYKLDSTSTKRGLVLG